MINGFKKYVTLGLFAVFVGLFGFCYGYEDKYSILSSKYIEIIDNDRVITTQGAANWGDYSWELDSIGNAETTFQGHSSDGIYLPINNPYNRLFNTLSVFWNNNKLYYYNSNDNQGFFQYFCTGSINNYISSSNNDFIKCLSSANGGLLSGSYETTIEYYLTPIEEFYTNGIYHNNIVAFLYVDSNGQGNYNANPSPFGFVYSDNSFVIFPFYVGVSVGVNPTNLTGSLGLNFSQPMSFASFQSMDSYKGQAPIPDLNNNQSTLIPIDTDVDKVIAFYENRFGWNKNMCFVGTFDLDSSFGASGISFEDGTGDSVFGLYYHLYSGYGSNIITNVGKFINVWLLNYSEWFYDNNIKRLATDNGPDTNVSYIYTGFTFPFANKPVAIYFMASSLYDGYARESSQGVDMSFYCYSKLNYQHIKDGEINYEEVKEMVGTGIIERIDTYVNYHLNPNSPSGNGDSYQVPTSGTFWDSFGTGYEDTDMDLDKTFSDYFTEITNVFQNYSPLYSTGIIPDYILYALIFLLLFRIMKH